MAGVWRGPCQTAGDRKRPSSAAGVAARLGLTLCSFPRSSRPAEQASGTELREVPVSEDRPWASRWEGQQLPSCSRSRARPQPQGPGTATSCDAEADTEAGLGGWGSLWSKVQAPPPVNRDPPGGWASRVHAGRLRDQSLSTGGLVVSLGDPGAGSPGPHCTDEAAGGTWMRQGPQGGREHSRLGELALPLQGPTSQGSPRPGRGWRGSAGPGRATFAPRPFPTPPPAGTPRGRRSSVPRTVSSGSSRGR